MSEPVSSPQPSAPNAADRIGPVVPPTQSSPVTAAAAPASVAQPVAAPSGVQPTPATVPVPAAPAQPQGADGQRTHVHSSYIWLGGLKTVVRPAVRGGGVLVGSSLIRIIADEAFSSDDFLIMTVVLGVVAVGGLVTIGLVFLLTWWSWKRLYYQVGSDEFTLYSGIFNKKQVHVPYQRVQSVDQQATLFQRIWGVCTVRIETAGGAANKAVVVPLRGAKGQAEWLRRELFARKQVALAGRGQAGLGSCPRNNSQPGALLLGRPGPGRLGQRARCAGVAVGRGGRRVRGRFRGNGPGQLRVRAFEPRACADGAFEQHGLRGGGHRPGGHARPGVHRRAAAAFRFGGCCPRLHSEGVYRCSRWLRHRRGRGGLHRGRPGHLAGFRAFYVPVLRWLQGAAPRQPHRGGTGPFPAPVFRSGRGPSAERGYPPVVHPPSHGLLRTVAGQGGQRCW